MDANDSYLFGVGVSRVVCALVSGRDVSEYVRRVDLTEVLGRGVLARRLYELASSGSIPGVVALPPLPAQARDACLYRLMQAKYRKPYYRAKLMNSPEVDGLLRLVYLSEKNVS